MCKGFVEWDVFVAVSGDGFAVVEGSCDGVSEGDCDVFDGVVWVDFEVTVAVDGEVEDGVGGKGVEHVVEEGDAGVGGGAPFTVEVEFDVDGGFCCLACAARSSGEHGW